jgi:hypothetical protein
VSLTLSVCILEVSLAHKWLSVFVATKVKLILARDWISRVVDSSFSCTHFLATRDKFCHLRRVRKNQCTGDPPLSSKDGRSCISRNYEKSTNFIYVMRRSRMYVLFPGQLLKVINIQEYLCIYIPTYLSIFLPTYLSIFLRTYLSIFIYLYVYILMSSIILSRVWVTTDGVRIGDSIYCPLIHSPLVTTLTHTA